MELIIVGVLSIFSLTISILVKIKTVQQINTQQEIIERVESKMASLTQTNNALQKQLKEVHSANYIFNEQLNRLTKEIEEAEARQLEIQSNDPTNKLYSRAVKMVELGADIEEIISECEIPRAEAELLINLHKK